MTTFKSGTTCDVHTFPRVFVSDRLDQGGRVSLTEGQAHHLCSVLRCSDGQGVRLFNGRDGEWLATLSVSGKRQADAILETCLCPQPLALPLVRLFFAPLPKDRMDILVEKAVELGVGVLHPVLTERTVVRTVNGVRLRRQIIEAAEQCERLDVPDLSDLTPVFSALERVDCPILACLERGAHPPLSCGAGSEGAIGLLIGPEGGFSPAEHAGLLRVSALRPVTLGPRILRAETAAIYALSRLACVA